MGQAANGAGSSLTSVTVDPRRAENSDRKKAETNCKGSQRRHFNTGRAEAANHQVVEGGHGPGSWHRKGSSAHPIGFEVERPPESASRRHHERGHRTDW